MGLDELLISTGVDALIKLIHDKKKIELYEAAKELNLPPSTVEDWAHVLEEQAIIKIEYQWSKVYLFWMETSPAELAREAEEASVHKEDVEESLGVLLHKIKDQGKELEATDAELKDIYKLLDPRILELSEKVKALKQLEKKAEEAADKQTAQLDKIKTEMDALSLQLQEKEEKFQSLAKGAFNLEGGGDFTPAGMLGFEKKIGKRTEALAEKLAELEERVESERGKLALPEEIAQSLATAKVELQEAKEMRDSIKESVGSLAEQKEMLEKAGLIGTKSQRAKNLAQIQKMSQELKALQSEAEKLGAQTTRITSEISGQADAFAQAEKLAQALEQKDLGSELTELLEKQSEVEKRLQSINQLYARADKASPAVSAKKVSAVSEELKQIAEEIKAEKTTLANDEKEVISRLNEQLSGREDLQKVRVEARKMLGPLIRDFDGLKAEYLRYSNEINKTNLAISSSVASVREELKGKIDDLQDRLEKFRAALERKSEIEEIISRVGELKKEEAQLAADVELLQKKVKIIELRKPKSPEQRAEADKFREDLDATRRQAEEFERKREELRDLIKRMWNREEEGG